MWYLEKKNTESKIFTFYQKYFLGYLQKSLDYIFIWNSLQQAVVKTDTLASF